MKRSFVVVGLVLVALLTIVTPVAAYSGVEGQVNNSKTGDAWAHGADVWIFRESDMAVLATCVLNTSGQIVADAEGEPCWYGSDALNHESLVGDPGSDYVLVMIDFECRTSNSCPPAGVNPPRTLETTYKEMSTWEGLYDLRELYTGTGPNAVTFAGVGGHSWPLLALVVPLVAGVSVLLGGHNKHRKP